MFSDFHVSFLHYCDHFIFSPLKTVQNILKLDKYEYKHESITLMDK